MKPIASRIVLSSDHGAFAVWEKARRLEAQGRRMIHLEVGEPDFGTPAHIVETAVSSLHDGRTHYDSVAGTAALREAAAAYLSRTRRISARPEHILPFPGVKAGLFFTLMALVELGDEVLLPNPGFPAYAEIVRMAGGTAVPYPLYPENHFVPKLDDLARRITPHTKCLILNSPANPSGAVFSATLIAELAALAEQHDLWLISDEIYTQIYFGDTFPASPISLLSMAQRTVLLDGFSKAYAMTGWRLGFGLFPEQVRAAVAKLMVNSHSSLPPFVMDAAVAALVGEQTAVSEMREAYRARRDGVLLALVTAGLTAVWPEGAFYVLVNVSQFGDGDSRAIADHLLRFSVATLPGDSMGSMGRGFLRLALTQPVPVLVEAVELIAEGLATYNP